MQVVIVLQQESGAGEPGQGWHSLQTIVGERQDVELRKGFTRKNYGNKLINEGSYPSTHLITPF